MTLWSFSRHHIIIPVIFFFFFNRFPCHFHVIRRSYVLSIRFWVLFALQSVALVLVIFHALRSSLIASFQVFFGLPRLRLPPTSWCMTLLIHLFFPHAHAIGDDCNRAWMFSFRRRDSELILSSRRTLHINNVFTECFLYSSAVFKFKKIICIYITFLYVTIKKKN